MCMTFVAVGRSLMIVSHVTFKMAALWFWTMFNCNPPIAHCYPLLWGGGILVDHWSTISSFARWHSHPIHLLFFCIDFFYVVVVFWIHNASSTYSHSLVAFVIAAIRPQRGSPDMYSSWNIWFVFALFGWFVWLMSVHCRINAFESWIIWFELHYGDVTQGPRHPKSPANRLFVEVNTRVNRYLQWLKISSKWQTFISWIQMFTSLHFLICRWPQQTHCIRIGSSTTRIYNTPISVPRSRLSKA